MRSGVAARARRSALAALWTGLGGVWRRRHRDAVIILTAHGVAGDSAAGATWHPLRPRLSLTRFDECLRILKQVYTFITLAEAVDILAGRRPPVPHALVLTFDDGYRTHVTEAGPVLQRHKVPATVFVSTGPAAARTPYWFDRLDYALQHASMNGATVSLGGRTVALDDRNRARLAATYAGIRRAVKAPMRDDREMNRELDALAGRLEAESGRRLADEFESDPWSAVLTPDEIRRGCAGIEFGSHTVDHLRINRLDATAASAQLRQSKADLEAWTGRPCRFFCYPDGGVSVEAARLVRGCGYEAAVTTDRGLNLIGDDLMWLRRIDLPVDGSAGELLAQVSGFKDWLLRLRGDPAPPSRHRRAADGGAAGTGGSNAPASK